MTAGLTFAEFATPFPQQRGWGVVLADRWAYVIVYDTEIGYTATFKDTERGPHQAVPIGGDFRSFGAAKKACEAHARERLS